MRFTMKLMFLSLTFLVLIWAGSAHAASEDWKGPGWYVVCDTEITAVLVSGPHTNEAACEAVLPAPDNPDKMCVYLCLNLKTNIEN